MKKEINDFIVLLEKEYGFEEFDACEDNGEIELHCNGGEIKVKIYVDLMVFDIYMDFCYPIDCYNGNFENEIKEENQILFIQILEKYFTIPPEEEFESGYGCPFDVSLIGYWGNKLDIDFVEKFMEAFNEFETSDLEIGKVFEKIYTRLYNLLVKKDYKVRKDKTFVNNEETIIISTTNVPIKEQFITDDRILNVDNTYYGVKRFLIRSEENKMVSAAKLEDVNDFLHVYDKTNCDDKIEMSSDFKKILYLRTKYFYAILGLNNISDFDFQELEYRYLMKKFKEFRPFKISTKIEELDFSKLTDSLFERLCYDLLVCMGFAEVPPIGKTNAPDGGKDIIATESVQTLLGEEKRRWIFQCKHSKKSLSRKDVSEIGDLLDENNAEKYGLFCSSELTPEAINRLKKKSLGEKVQFWGKIEIQSKLSIFPQLIEKYDLL